MPAIAKTQTIGGQQVNTAEMTGFNFAGIYSAIETSKRLQSTKPGATVETLSAAVILASTFMAAGELVTTTEYISGTGIGGNVYKLLDAGSAGNRPLSDGGSVIHVGSSGYYLKGLFPNGVWIEQFGARPVPGVDNADAIENAAAYRVCGELYVGFGEFELARTVFLPVGIMLAGSSGNRGFDDTYDYSTAFTPQSAGTYVENYLFFQNIDPNGDTETWVEHYPNNDSGGAKNLVIDGTNTGDINGFKFAGSYIYKNIHNKKVGTLIGKPPGVYTDKVEVNQIHSTLRANQTDYLIDLPGLGDGYDIGNIAPAYVNGEGDGITKGVYVGACRSGQLYNLINGEHMVNGAMSIEIYGMHIEGGSITLKDCSAHVRDGILFCEENAIGQIILESDNGVYNNRYEVTISNVVFDQSFNRRGGLQQTARPDIVLNPYFTVNINDCKRKITDSNNISIQQYYGVLVGTDSTTMLPAFNNYSHLLSKRCTIANNVPFVDGMIPAQRKTFGGLIGATVTIADAAFNGATGTYYYQAQLLQDPVRLLGRNATNAEVSLSLTNGGDMAELVIGWSFVTNKSKFILRVYRGTTPGSYDKYVDIPISSAVKLYDTGVNISGFVWQSRAAAGVDGINSGADGAIVLSDGILLGKTVGIKPTLGTWKTGDELQKTNPNLSGVGTNTNNRFLRLTDGSAHVSNTDWLTLGSIQG